MQQPSHYQRTLLAAFAQAILPPGGHAAPGADEAHVDEKLTRVVAEFSPFSRRLVGALLAGL
ncbi:MAG: hypothetical protein B6D41_02130, partial [Chloroflexi bacterium UTCFX4]